MLASRRLCLTIILLLTSSVAFVQSGCDNCCDSLGGIQYCDSSAGRYVCKNGDYSACYCTRHAVMELQKLQGCCLWQGGVFKITETGLVLCNNGSTSEICGLQTTVEPVSSF